MNSSSLSEALIDITRLVDRRMQGRLPTGIDRVSLEYIRHFQSRSTALIRYAGCWIELNRPQSREMYDALLSPPAHLTRLVRRLVAKAFPRCVVRRFSRPRFLFNTGHSGLEQKEYVARLQRSQLKPLFFVHDLIPLSHPEYCRPGESRRHQVRMNTILTMGRGIIANSADTLEQLANYARRCDLPLPPAVIAPLAPARFEDAVDACPLIAHPYFVLLGTIEPRKNHWIVLHLWRQLIERLGNDAPRLVIIGQRGWECENVVDLLERCTMLRGFVFEYSACTDTELAAWLRHARALLFPSFIEGYGMPLVEALALGVPVIASDLPVFREIAGDIPEYVNPLDGKQWEKLVEEYSSESPARSRQCHRMKGFTPPSWENHFARVEELMVLAADIEPRGEHHTRTRP